MFSPILENRGARAAMYEEFYGLSARAFEPEADPNFYFPSLSSRKVMTTVGHGLNRGGGIALVSGPSGIGKTTLLLHLRERFASEPASLGLMSAAGADDSGLVVAAGRALGVEGVERRPDRALAYLGRFLEERALSGERIILFIDDAGAIGTEELAALHSLARLRLGEKPLLQIVLAGEEALADRMADIEGFDELRARLATICHLGVLLQDEMGPYLEARLKNVGWDNRPEIDAHLPDSLYRVTGGNPGAVGRMMTRLLERAAAEESMALQPDLLSAISQEFPSFAPHGLQNGAGENENTQTEGSSAADRGDDNMSRDSMKDSQEEAREIAAVPAGLAEAQIRAIEEAFVQRDRLTNRLRRDLDEIRNGPQASSVLPERLAAIEARLDEQEEILRHLLARMITFFETGRSDEEAG